MKINPGVPGFTNPKILGFLFDCLIAQSPTQCLEIGTWMGRSASVICTALGSLGGERSLLCVDAFGQTYNEAYIQRDIMQKALNVCGDDVRATYTDFKNLATVEDCYQLTLDRYPFMKRFCRLMKANSLNLDPADLPEIDFAYIDGDHTYEGVRSDCILATSRLTEHGMLVFDDYVETFPGLVQFIDQLKASGLAAFAGQEQHNIAFTVESPNELVQHLSAS